MNAAEALFAGQFSGFLLIKRVIKLKDGSFLTIILGNGMNRFGGYLTGKVIVLVSL